MTHKRRRRPGWKHIGRLAVLRFGFTTNGGTRFERGETVIVVGAWRGMFDVREPLETSEADASTPAKVRYARKVCGSDLIFKSPEVTAEEYDIREGRETF